VIRTSHFGDPHLFFPYLQLHEFEALLLTNLEAFEIEFPDPEYADALQNLRRDIGQTPPEEVNEGQETAPSKRILKHIPGYSKAVAGINLVGLIGLPALRERCPHFRAWLERLEKLGEV
jgi:hypothetical protein